MVVRRLSHVLRNAGLTILLAAGLASRAHAQGGSSVGTKPPTPPVSTGGSAIPTSAMPAAPVVPSIIPDWAMPPAPPPDPGITLQIPPELAGFALVGRKDFENPTEGTQLRYSRADSLFVDVIVSGGPDFAKCDLACSTKAFDGDFAKLRAGYTDLVNSGIARSAQLGPEEPLNPPSGARWRLGRRLRATLLLDLGAERSELYLFMLPGVSVKVRATYADRGDRAAAVTAFAERIVAGLTGNTKP